MSDSKPSMPHLVRHQRDLDEYTHNVSKSSDSRFGPAWWGVFEQHDLLASDGRLVDLGTGPGQLLRAARARYPSAELVGVEVHPDLLVLAQETAADIGATIVEADLALPSSLEPASVDVVTSSLVFHELPYPPALLKEAARVVKPGGYLVLFDIVKWPLSVYMENRELSEDVLDHFREHCLFSPEDLSWLVSHHGFSVVEVIGRMNGRFAMVVAKRNAD